MEREILLRLAIGTILFALANVILASFFLGFSLAMYRTSRYYIRELVARKAEREIRLRCRHCQLKNPATESTNEATETTSDDTDTRL